MTDTDTPAGNYAAVCVAGVPANLTTVRPGLPQISLWLGWINGTYNDAPMTVSGPFPTMTSALDLGSPVLSQSQAASLGGIENSAALHCKQAEHC